MDDRELLAEFLGGSREALGRLVERYVNLVYSAAARQVRDPHLAADVTQGVFVVLATKAKSVRHHAALGSWLLKVTRYAALDAMKAKGRRTKHEERAAGMRHEAEENVDAQWNEVREVLDDAMVHLPEKDRRAVVLRFFEQRSVDEVAELMGVSPEAAKQRIFRAIEKLRGRLGGKGVAMQAAALAALIGSRAVEAAPAGLSVAATTAAGGGVGGSSVAYGIAKGTVKIMAWTKIKAAAIVTVAAMAVGGSAVVVTRAIGGGDVAAKSPAPPLAPAVPVADGLGTGNAAGGSGSGIGEKPASKDWVAKFHAVYGLEAGQVVKRVPPPFIDERWNFWKSQQPRLPALKPGEQMPEKLFIIEWDGAEYHWKLASLADGNLGVAMTQLLGLKGWEVDAPPAVKEARLPGDWVVLKGTKFSDKLAAVETIARQAGLKISIKETIKPIDVLVAHGTLKLNGAVDERGRHLLELRMGEEPTHDGPAFPTPPASSATMREVFDHAESMFDTPIIDESGSALSRVMLREYPGFFKSREKAMDQALVSLMQQTGLVLEKEKREMTVWEVREDK